MESSEDALLCRFGTPLDPLEEDDVPAKKPTPIEDQIVTDENGRRRFHGAFTGGFSAGFWNTVGSLEGWKPQSFKSSRSEKAEKRQKQLPSDFMDDEDLGEFGIAPQRVQAREDFSRSDESSSLRKRKLPLKDSSGIPGIPVLHQLLEPSRDKVAVRLLKRMGWKPNQGIGARQTRREKNRSNKQNAREMYVMKMYGCTSNSSEANTEKPESLGSDGSGEDDDEENMENITFAPDDYEPFVCSVKDNVFGLGYSGLSREGGVGSKSHINLFGPLEVLGKDNKKLSIRGQAFGVGALEEEDEDIYARDDMSQYDFSLGDKKKRNKGKLPLAQEIGVLEGFAESSTNSDVNKTVHVVELRANFQPRNWSQRKSRFDPLPQEKRSLMTKNDEIKQKGLGRHDLNPDDRRNILEGIIAKPHQNQKPQTEATENKKSYLQQINEKYKERENKTKKLLDLLSSKEDNFVKGGLVTSAGVEIMQPIQIDKLVENENQKILCEAKKITKSLDNTPGVFKPFASNEPKQERYEQFLAKNLHGDDEIKEFLKAIQPLHLTEWDREMEFKEFVQARNIYKPLNGIMSERFVSRSTDDVAKPLIKLAEEKVKVVVKRNKVLWKPCSLICKRFNIPEPHGGALEEPKVHKKNKFSVFDYIENSVNSKKDFVTPVIIPKLIEKPKQIQTQTTIYEGKDTSSLEGIITPSTSRDIVIEQYIHETPFLNASKQFLAEKKKPKSELELRIEENRDKHPSEKKDLFKCIFDSSSEEEDEADKALDQESDKTSATIVISDDIVNSLVKPSVPINLLRNNSPPRGIFAALLSKAETPEDKPKHVETVVTEKSDKITFKTRRERINEQPDNDHENAYGPKIPDVLLNKRSESNTESEIDKRLAELLSSNNLKKAKIVEEWVEKKSTSTKKSKKDKYDKKKKDHKKKDEHKHKHSKKHKKDKKIKKS